MLSAYASEAVPYWRDPQPSAASVSSCGTSSGERTSVRTVHGVLSISMRNPDLCRAACGVNHSDEPIQGRRDQSGAGGIGHSMNLSRAAASAYSIKHHDDEIAMSL